MVMWSLSLPQVAATLAATLVGFRAKLLTEDVLNSVIVLMLVTSTLGPVLTAKFAPKLESAEVSQGEADAIAWNESSDRSLMAVVPVYNPKTEQNLIELAALLTRDHNESRIVPLAIAVGHSHMNDPQLTASLRRSQELLTSAVEISRQIGVEANPLIRIDDSIAQGINRASREQNADLIVMGWGRRTGFQARLFGNVIDSVLWSSHCPVAISRLLDSPTRLQRILVPLENLDSRNTWTVYFANSLAKANGGTVTLLNVCDRSTSSGRIAWMKAQLEILASRNEAIQSEVRVELCDDVVRGIANLSQTYDLVILRSQPRRTSAGGLAVSDLTTQIAQNLSCSIILLGEPQPFPGANMMLSGAVGDRPNLRLKPTSLS
jgi:nucleotide-binding universal stress UspA family protein